MNRRDFIKAGMSAFTIASSGRAIGIDAPSNRVRLAIVGCHEKGRGQSLMRGTMKVPGIEIACVCDVDSRAMDWAANLVEKTRGNRPKKEKDLRRVLEDRTIDGIVSETPDHWHAYSAVLAMNAGKAVYVEKPCAFCPRECEVILETWKRTGMVFQMGVQRRASRSYKAALDYIHETNVIGDLKWVKCWYMSNRASIGRGRPVEIPKWLDWELWQGPAPRVAFRDNLVHYNWHWFRNWGTSEVGNNAPHYLDLARWALNVGYPETVECAGGRFFDKNDDYEWPDTFNASYRFSNGKFVTFEMASHANVKPYMQSSTGAMAYGEHGALYFGSDDSVTLFDGKSRVVREWKGGDTETGSLTNPTASLDVPNQAKFAECIRTKSQATNSPADDAVKTTLMTLLTNIAVETGEPVRLDSATGRVLSKNAAAFWSREYAKGWDIEALS